MNIKKIIYTLLAINIPLIILSSFFIDIPLARWTFPQVGGTMDVVSGILTEGAVSTPWLIVTGLLYLVTKFWYKNELLRSRAGFLFISIVSSGLIVNILKVVFAKTRPRLLREEDLYTFEFFKSDYVYASFPSGHTTTAFAIAISLLLMFPRWWPAFITYGVIMGLSRIGYMQHYLSDVIAGATLGTIVTLLLYATHKFTLRKTV